MFSGFKNDDKKPQYFYLVDINFIVWKTNFPIN